jgi:Rrf2 family protein
MKLSTRARYALQFMVAVSRMSREGKPISLAVVAEHTQLSKRYLEKLVVGLKRAGLLRPVPGRTGGYLLARPARDIRIGQIVEASIGPINIVECVGCPHSCWRSDDCECRLIYRLINERITEALYDYTLADMAEGHLQEAIDKRLTTESRSLGLSEVDERWPICAR